MALRGETLSSFLRIRWWMFAWCGHGQYSNMKNARDARLLGTHPSFRWLTETYRLIRNANGTLLRCEKARVQFAASPSSVMVGLTLATDAFVKAKPRGWKAASKRV